MEQIVASVKKIALQWKPKYVNEIKYILRQTELYYILLI